MTTYLKYWTSNIVQLRPPAVRLNPHYYMYSHFRNKSCMAIEVPDLQDVSSQILLRAIGNLWTCIMLALLMLFHFVLSKNLFLNSNFSHNYFLIASNPAKILNQRFVIMRKVGVQEEILGGSEVEHQKSKCGASLQIFKITCYFECSQKESPIHHHHPSIIIIIIIIITYIRQRDSGINITLKFDGETAKKPYNITFRNGL